MWGQFHESVDFRQLAAACRVVGLHISDGVRYQTDSESRPSHLRLGFASLNDEELIQSVQLLEQVLRARYPR